MNVLKDSTYSELLFSCLSLFDKKSDEALRLLSSSIALKVIAMISG